MRHPRPLTAAELHLELEKEQEAVVRSRHSHWSVAMDANIPSQVNRLTRELTALRAHSASVASTTSSTSTQPNPADVQSQRPVSSHHHRSSSSVSRTSFSHGIPLNPSTSGIPHHHRPSLSGTREGTADGARPGVSRTMSNVSSSRYEETAQARMELEEAKRENEVLRRRVRDLEIQLRRRRSESERSHSREATTGTADASEPRAP